MQLQFAQYQLMGNTVVSALPRSKCQSSEETDDMWAFHHAIPLMMSDGPIDFRGVGWGGGRGMRVARVIVSVPSSKAARAYELVINCVVCAVCVVCVVIV